MGTKFAERVEAVAGKAAAAADAPLFAKAGIIQDAVGEMLGVLAEMAAEVDRLSALAAGQGGA